MNVLDQKKEMCLSFDTPPFVNNYSYTVSYFTLVKYKRSGADNMIGSSPISLYIS